MFYLLCLLGKIGKIFEVIIFISSAIVLYFSLSFNYVQTKDMFALLWLTNVHEAMGVFSPVLFVYLAAGTVLTYLALRTFPKKTALASWAGLLILCLLCGAAKQFQPVELKGRHPMPAGYLSHFGHSVKQQWRMKDMFALRTELPGNVVYRREGGSPLFVVLALGESLRADHLTLYGYERETTPLSGQLPLTVFDRCYSAGAGTTESVTRMLTRATLGSPAAALTEKSVISLFRKAGFRTVWLTNQGAMATGETPVASIAKECELYKTHPSVHTIGARIQDSDLLPMLDEILTLPPQDTLIILHSFGSHINPEHRYADEFRRYLPICSSFSVADCSDQELVNSYDNSILATDAYWKGLADRLKDRNAVLIVTSDHGDRLHGGRGHSPSLMDHPELRWIPFMVYASPFFRENPKHREQLTQAAAHTAVPCSHDYLFHSLLGISGIGTPCYDEKLDVFSKAMTPYADPYVVLKGLKQTSPL
ncbi:phosphoethanolamine transferase [uncultured Mailhella sp.]|uniref:phosphoethanolamine transferase n=1 Tax=uncultured Mailhella sp. TaxID=1981031 RepID=UPI0026364436|nr:phosphoethanolamine transferase [uncultured Mailhella sp.]